MPKKKETTSIQLFVASGAETKPIRDKVLIGLKELSQQHENSGFEFELLWWEDQSDAVPLDGSSQDQYNKLIDKSDMVAVIIHNTLGTFTEEEFNHAVKVFKSNRKSPITAVYTLPTDADNEARYLFLKSLQPNKKEYFRRRAENPDQLIDKIKGALLRIKNDYEAEQKAAVQETEDYIRRSDIDSDLTKEAVELFHQKDYIAASASLNMEAIREQAKKISAKAKEVAEAFVLKAKLELTNAQNKNRFATAENLFDEALHASRHPEIVFEYAYYCDEQNMFKKAEKLYIETLEGCRALAADNPAAYNPDVAMTLNNLAILHSDINDYQQAEQEYKEALEIRRALAAENPAAYNPDVAMTLNNLAILHSDINDYEQAEQEYKEALELYRALAADNPAAYKPYVATTLNNLAILHDDTKEYEQAEQEYKEALELITPYYEAYPNAFRDDYNRIKRNLDELAER